MPLSDKDKTEAIDALALAVALNEPESMIENLRRLSRSRALDPLIDANARNRWRLTQDALESVSQELERLNAPRTRQEGEQAQDAPQSPQSADC